MPVRDKHLYYGIALTQIAEYPVATSINKIGNKKGLFQINNDKLLLIKYSSADEAPWSFSFSEDDISTVNENRLDIFVVLICGYETVCLLNSDDIDELLNLDDGFETSQSIRVTYYDDGQLHVSGSKDELYRRVANQSFPSGLFYDTTDFDEDYAWPPFSSINAYKEPPRKILSSNDRTLDLADTLTGNFDFFSDELVTEPIYFGLSTIDHHWESWDEKRLCQIEELINEDFSFDGYSVEIERLSGDYDIPCYREFLWKLNISEDMSEDNSDPSLIESMDDPDSKPEIRNVSTATDFPNLIYPDGKMIVTSLEIDVDSLQQTEKYQYGGWEELIRIITSEWVNKNSYDGIATIWALGSPSINFHQPSYSVFYAIFGMPKSFRDFLTQRISVLGKHVRPESDFITPSLKDGWMKTCHIEDGKTWVEVDPASWAEVK